MVSPSPLTLNQVLIRQRISRDEHAHRLAEDVLVVAVVVLERDLVGGRVTLDLVGITEIGERAGVSRDTVFKWRARYADFPAPVATISAGSFWDWRDVEAWLRRTGRLG